MAYQANIGMEVHVQLNTRTKIFCACQNQANQQPNSNICPICTGYPGVLPVLNKEVVNCAIRIGLATHCSITPITTFARKHYFYPDLPKNYQITQDADPICREGYVTIQREDGTLKKIRLVRIHIEEDAGKNMHSASTGESFIDFNRTGTPLLEIVSYPDIENAHETREYLKALHNIVLHLGIGTGNMEEGAFRADTNISVRKQDVEKLGTKVELKNINSFKFIYDAIIHEIERQTTLLESGGKVKQETRLWDSKNKQTIAMRSKEESADYRYFQEPDLPAVHIDHAWIESIKTTLPELPEQKLERLMQNCGLSAYEAAILIDDIALATYFDQAYALCKSKNLINWVLRNVIAYLKDHKLSLAEFKLTPHLLAELVQLIDNGTINNKVAQEVFEQAATQGTSPAAIVREQNLAQIESSDELEGIVRTIIQENAAQVAQYKAGNERLFGFFVGQVMKATGGKANPRIINELLKKHLAL